MQIELIHQTAIGPQPCKRVGDVLNTIITTNWCKTFRFAVAYMTLSGLARIRNSLDLLITRGGTVSGAVGIDGITTLESLQTLHDISADSTIFHTVSFNYHPKVYLMSGDDRASAIVGSANLTRNGLYRNIEIAVQLDLDLTDSYDLNVHQQCIDTIDAFKDTSHPNAQAITNQLLQQLLDNGVIAMESRIERDTPEVDLTVSNLRSQNLAAMFPSISIPVPPPSQSPLSALRATARVPSVSPPSSMVSTVLIIQLSAFDCSHRSSIPGTPEILVPLDAETFFPPLARGANYMETHFDVLVHDPNGQRVLNGRLWYYDSRHELRLRLCTRTIDMTTPGGGDLVVITKTSPTGRTPFELSVIEQNHPSYPTFSSLCNRVSQGKRWGIN